MKEKNNRFAGKESPSVCLSFTETIAGVKAEVNMESFPASDRPQVEELCLIIAEVLMIDPADRLKIAGTVLPASAVQEIFGQITGEHIALVIEQYNRIAYEIRFKKAYLRSAMYNSVFELESHYTNLVKTTLG